MGVLDLVSAELRDVRLLANEFTVAHREKDFALATETLDALCAAVLYHIEVEEEIFYPALCRRGDELAGLVATAIADHAEATALIKQIEGMDGARPELGELVSLLADVTTRHEVQAEQALFPLLRSTMNGELAVLGRRYADVRRNVREDAMFPQLLALLLGPDSCCLDIGGNKGIVLQDMVRCAPDGKHIAYEPVPALARQLRQRFPTVDVREAAVSDRDGTTKFFHVKEDAAYSSLGDRGGATRGWPEHVGQTGLEEIVVRTESLDSALPPGWVPDFIKIDVEGAEGLVLAGAAEVLATHRPIVVIEHLGTGLAGGYDTTGIWQMLVDQAGMRVFDLQGRGPFTKEEFLRSAERLANTNYLARP